MCVCVCVCLVPQLCPSLCSLPGSSVHRIFQARIQEWVAISSSRASSQPRDCTNPGLLHCRQILYHLSHQGRLQGVLGPVNSFGRQRRGPANSLPPISAPSRPPTERHLLHVRVVTELAPPAGELTLNKSTLAARVSDLPARPAPAL